MHVEVDALKPFLRVDRQKIRSIQGVNHVLLPVLSDLLVWEYTMVEYPIVNLLQKSYNRRLKILTSRLKGISPQDFESRLKSLNFCLYSEVMSLNDPSSGLRLSCG